MAHCSGVWQLHFMSHVEKQRKSLHELHLLSLGVNAGPSPIKLARERKSEATQYRRDADNRLVDSMEQRQNAQLVAISISKRDEPVARAKFILMKVGVVPDVHYLDIRYSFG